MGESTSVSVTAKKTRLNVSTRKDQFLESFAKHGIVARACEAAGIDRRQISRWKADDSAFLASYNDALEEAKDKIREEIRRRAEDGWDEDVYQLGKYAGKIHRYSDTLLIFHAKALMPEYRDKQQVEHSGSIDSRVEVYLPQKQALATPPPVDVVEEGG